MLSFPEITLNGLDTGVLLRICDPHRRAVYGTHELGNGTQAYLRLQWDRILSIAMIQKICMHRP